MVYQLAQLNIAIAFAPRDDPRMADFYDNLVLINELAEQSEGFVWRLKDDSGDATSIRAFPDERILANMSVWKDLESLRKYVYTSGHLPFLRRRHEWFEKPKGAYQVLWWIPEGHQPDHEEARTRLEKLNAEGPGPDAFTFGKPFPPPGSAHKTG